LEVTDGTTLPPTPLLLLLLLLLLLCATCRGIHRPIDIDKSRQSSTNSTN